MLSVGAATTCILDRGLSVHARGFFLCPFANTAYYRFEFTKTVDGLEPVPGCWTLVQGGALAEAVFRGPHSSTTAVAMPTPQLLPPSRTAPRPLRPLPVAQFHRPITLPAHYRQAALLNGLQAIFLTFPHPHPPAFPTLYPTQHTTLLFSYIVPTPFTHHTHSTGCCCTLPTTYLTHSGLRANHTTHRTLRLLNQHRTCAYPFFTFTLPFVIPAHLHSLLFHTHRFKRSFVFSGYVCLL